MYYVEYIQNGSGSSESSGWNILLGYTPSNTTNVAMRTKIETPNNRFNGDCLIGAKGGDGNFFRFFGHKSNQMTFDCPNDSEGRVYTSYTGTTEWDMSWANGTLTLTNLTANLTTTGSTYRTATFTQEWSVWLNSVQENTKIYYIEAYENGVKVRDWRPALDNQNRVCLYEKIGGTFHYPTDKTPIIGPILSTITVTPSKTTLPSSGDSISIVVDTQNPWTVSGDTWLVLSESGDTSGTTITATAPSYTGTTAREDTLTFTDTVSLDTVEITIKQKKYSSGQPFYLGVDEIAEMYLGIDGISEAYLGEDLVFSTGPFVGLKVSPKTLTFSSSESIKTVKVKSSEPWDMTVPAWLTADVLSGDTGSTVVTLTASALTAETSGSVVVTSTTYSASCDVQYMIGVPYLDVVGRLGIVTDFYVGQFYRSDRYIKLEVAAKGSATTTSQTYLYETNPITPWFSMESFVTNNFPYVNMASTTGAFNGSTGGNGLDNPWTIIVDREGGQSVINGSTAQTRTIVGNWPADSTPLIFFGTYSTNTRTRFYHMKIWDRSGNLVKHFVPDPSGSIKDLVSGTIYSITSGGTSTYGLEVI